MHQLSESKEQLFNDVKRTGMHHPTVHRELINKPVSIGRSAYLDSIGDCRGTSATSVRGRGLCVACFMGAGAGEDIAVRALELRINDS